jgi:hypothetical protein
MATPFDFLLGQTQSLGNVGEVGGILTQALNDPEGTAKLLARAAPPPVKKPGAAVGAPVGAAAPNFGGIGTALQAGVFNPPQQPAAPAALGAPPAPAAMNPQLLQQLLALTQGGGGLGGGNPLGALLGG